MSPSEILCGSSEVLLMSFKYFVGLVEVTYRIVKSSMGPTMVFHAPPS